MPAWLINGVVVAIRRNEGTKRRRPASLDPYTQPATHTVSHTNQIQCKFFTLFCQICYSLKQPCRIIASWFPYFIFIFHLLNSFLLAFTLYYFFFSHHITVFQSSYFLVQGRVRIFMFTFSLFVLLSPNTGPTANDQFSTPLCTCRSHTSSSSSVFFLTSVLPFCATPRLSSLIPLLTSFFTTPVFSSALLFHLPSSLPPSPFSTPLASPLLPPLHCFPL